jgi:glycosyltransferase involved in cell wall biosynthesis
MKSVSHLITTVERGGAENQLLVLVKEQIASGWHVEVIPLKGSLELESELNVLGAELNLSLHNKSILVQMFILRVRLAKSIPLLHAHLPRAELIAAVARKRKTFLFTRHNAESFMPTLPGIVSVTLSRFVTLRASHGIAISHAVKKFLLETREVPKKYSIHVIHYGYIARTSNYLEFNHQKLSAQSRNSNSLRIGMIGRLVPQKDYPTLLKAFAKFSESFPASLLQIIGSGYLKDELSQLSYSLGIENRVEWVGKISNVFDYLEDFDLFVLTSSYEGFGLVLLEAMDAGVPILASRNSAIPEVMGVDYPGLFQTSNAIQLADKMIQVMTSPEVQQSFIKLYAERIDSFAAAKMWHSIEDVYRRVGN